MYNKIANCNVILDNIDVDKTIFTGNNYNRIKAEALALRAFMHFDLLRMFAPAYNETNKNSTGIPYVDEVGRYFDFHALRGELGTLLAASGTHPKVAQSIMRHSDINLTMSLYTHTLRGQESEAIENLTDLSLPGKESQSAKSTGTDDIIQGENYFAICLAKSRTNSH